MALDQISPYLGGLGLASGAVAFNVACYYNTIIAWCLRYLMQVRFIVIVIVIFIVIVIVAVIVIIIVY